MRPILGHIHSGGLRFKDDIEGAFKRQGLMLSQSLWKLENIQSTKKFNNAPANPDDVLRALWHRSRELHYVAHFREPLDVDIGDIGYITGNPPQFTCLDNVYEKISDGHLLPRRIQRSRFTPQGRWNTEEVQGIVRCVSEVTDVGRLTCWDHGARHAFQFRDSDATELADWDTGRPRLDKDFMLRRINRPNEQGLVVDCAQAWECLAERANDLAANHNERTISPPNLILGLLHH